MDNVVYRVGVFVPIILLSLAFHEFSHAYVAYRLGDRTAYNQGRMTLNPLSHLDPIGTAVMVITSIMGLGFGWAKPVPIQAMNFRNPLKGMMLTALAGPLSNYTIAFIFSMLIRLLEYLQVSLPIGIQTMLAMVVILNLLLGSFNLLPIPPFDGSRIVAAFLPRNLLHEYYKLERYWLIILMVLIMTRIGMWFYFPLAYFVGKLLWIKPELINLFAIWAR